MNRLRIISWLAGIFWMSGLVQAQDSLWSCDIYAYRYDMTVFGTLQLHGEEQTVVSGEYEVAAFCGDECRGVATVDLVPVEEVAYYYMRIRSNVAGGEEITFKCYDWAARKEVEIATVLAFAEGTLKGYPSEPFVLQEKTYDIVIEAADGGNVSGGGTFVRGEEVTLTAMSEEGYHFVEWSDGTTDNPYLWVVDSDKELSAVFEPNIYTLTYVVDGEVYATMEVPYGSAIAPIDAPERPGCVFSGWQHVPEVMPAHDVEVSGSFTTGIEGIVRSGRWVDVYDTRGILVRCHIDSHELDVLPEGLYIIKGQKILIK